MKFTFSVFLMPAYIISIVFLPALIISCRADREHETPLMLKLSVSDDNRFLQKEDGSPFFWLGDTAWRLFAHLDSTEVDRYFEDRKNKGFTVIQCHFLPVNMRETNTYGEYAFVENNITRPNEDYWLHVDYIVQRSHDYGLYLAILPAWARTYIEAVRGDPADKVFTKDTLGTYQYGRFIGERYKAYPHIIWVLGGDTWGTKDTIYYQLAKGIADGAAEGDFDKVLMTFHPKGGTYRPPATSTGEFYHDKEWLDFNMIQSGHRIGNRNFDRINEDYGRIPVKPTIDSEPCYEHHPVLHNYKNGAFKAWHLRRRGYWSVLAGGFGYTYGATGIYQMSKPGHEGKASHFKDYWYNALDYEGAKDMQHLRHLMESRPFINPARVPDQSIILNPSDSIDFHIQSARADDYSYWIIYFTNGCRATIDLSVSGKRSYQAWWYNPRDGKTYDEAENASEMPFSEFIVDAPRTFDPPGEEGPDNDWVLIIDDMRAGYRKPGL